MLELILQTLGSGAAPSTLNLKNLGFSAAVGEQILNCLLQRNIDNLIHLDLAENLEWWTSDACF